MAVVNVNREVEDQFYRYKMPKIIAKVCMVIMQVLYNVLDARIAGVFA